MIRVSCVGFVFSDATLNDVEIWNDVEDLASKSRILIISGGDSKSMNSLQLSIVL